MNKSIHEPQSRRNGAVEKKCPRRAVDRKKEEAASNSGVDPNAAQ